MHIRPSQNIHYLSIILTISVKKILLRNLNLETQGIYYVYEDQDLLFSVAFV